MLKVVFDPLCLLPGSPKLQERLGGTVPPERFLLLFPEETWLDTETYLMSLCEVTEELLVEASVVARRQAGKKLHEDSF